MSRKKKRKKSPGKTSKPAPEPTQHRLEPVVPQKPANPPRRPVFDLLFVAGAAFIVFFIYSNSLDGPFLFDDTNNIQYNNAIKITELSPESIRSAAFDSPHPRRFVAYLSFALNYYLHQDQTAGYHLVNILIHVITGVLVYYFTVLTLNLPALRGRYPRSREIALFVAILWLVHPIAAQSVAYLVQRMNSLATMFYMLSLLSYAYGRQTRAHRKRVFWFSSSLLSGVLALGSKEIAATLPFFIILYEWFFFQDLDRRWIRRNLPLIGALITFAVIVGLIATHGNPLAGFDNRPFTFTERLLTQFRVVLFYLSLLLFPHPSRLTINHDFSLSHGLLDPATTLLAILAVAGLLALTVVSARRERLLSFCILWFFGHLAIESSILPLEIIFEHRTYLPSIGLFTLGVAMFYRFTHTPKVQLTSLALLALVWTLWAHERSGVWSDKVAFWTDAAEKTPKVARIYNNLGFALEEQGKLDEALDQYNKAYSLDPGLYRALNNIGSIHLEKKNYDKAIRTFHKSMKINPRDVDAYKGLALTYYAMKDREKYREYLEKVRAIEGPAAPR